MLMKVQSMGLERRKPKSQSTRKRFDRGYISFEDDGGLILSKQLPEAVRLTWDVTQKIPRVPFLAAQAQYLNYHRAELLRK